MGRPSVISYTDVEEAVQMLQRQGKPINPYQVKSIIGQGSEAKILYYLKGMGFDVEFQDSDPLTKRLVNLVRPIFVELYERNEEQIQKAKEDLENSLRDERKNAEELLTQLKEVAKKLKEESSRADSLHTEVLKLNEELTKEQKRSLDLEQQKALLVQKLTDAERFIQDSEKLRELQKAEHKDLIQLLKSEHTETLQGYKEALDQASRTTTQQQEALGQADAKISALKVELDGARVENLKFRETMARITEEKAADSRTLAKMQKLVAEQNDQIEAQKSEARILEARTTEMLQDIKNSNTDLRNENEALKKRNDRLSTELELLKSILDRFSGQLSPRVTDPSPDEEA